MAVNSKPVKYRIIAFAIVTSAGRAAVAVVVPLTRGVLRRSKPRCPGVPFRTPRGPTDGERPVPVRASRRSPGPEAVDRRHLERGDA